MKIEITEKIVVQQSGDFDPADFTDRYEDALRALIEESKQGNGPERKRAEGYAAAVGASKKKPSARGRKAAWGLGSFLRGNHRGAGVMFSGSMRLPPALACRLRTRPGDASRVRRAGATNRR